MNSHTTHTPTTNAADGRLMLGVHRDHADEHALEVERALSIEHLDLLTCVAAHRSHNLSHAA